MNLARNRNGFLVSETHRECTSCHEIFEKTCQTMRICSSCNGLRVKSNSAEYKMVARAKHRAQKGGYSFNIDVTDVVIPKHCPALGIELYITSGKPGAFINSPSLDKINPELGYTKGNVQVLSQLANQMKGAATQEQLLLFADWIYKTYGGGREIPG